MILATLSVLERLRAVGASQLACAWLIPRVMSDQPLHIFLTKSRTKHACSHFVSADAGLRGVFDPQWEIWTFTVPETMRSDLLPDRA